MILHILTDEKFTDYAIAQFSAPEMQSDFVLIPSNNVMHLVKHIDQCTVIRQGSPEFEDLLNRLGQYSCIILHGMFWGRWQTPILRQVPENVKVAWVYWGGDLYSRQDVESHFFAPITGLLFRLHNRKKNKAPDTSWEIPFDLYKRVDYCLNSISAEYDFAKQYTGADFEYLWYTYYSLEETIGSLKDKSCNGNNIWVGNSAAVKNNHIDAIWQLWKSGVLHKHNNVKVIIPLSYGDPWIRNLVLKVGRFFFGKRMQPLVSFMPREEYNALMLSCSTMIINYYEPAANGNIITALWLGMRVYISEKNFVFDFYKRIGLSVYSLESDLPQYGFAPLSEDVRQHNRDVIASLYGMPHIKEEVTKIVKTLSTPKK